MEYSRIFWIQFVYVFFQRARLAPLSHAAARQGMSGNNWRFNIKAVYEVFFMNFLFKDNVKFRIDVILADRKTGEQIPDKMKQIFLFLPVFDMPIDIIIKYSGLTPEETAALQLPDYQVIITQQTI